MKERNLVSRLVDAPSSSLRFQRFQTFLHVASSSSLFQALQDLRTSGIAHDFWNRSTLEDLRTSGIAPTFGIAPNLKLQ